MEEEEKVGGGGGAEEDAESGEKAKERVSGEGSRCEQPAGKRGTVEEENWVSDQAEGRRRGRELPKSEIIKTIIAQFRVEVVVVVGGGGTDVSGCFKTCHGDSLSCRKNVPCRAGGNFFLSPTLKGKMRKGSRIASSGSLQARGLERKLKESDKLDLKCVRRALSEVVSCVRRSARLPFVLLSSQYPHIVCYLTHISKLGYVFDVTPLFTEMSRCQSLSLQPSASDMLLTGCKRVNMAPRAMRAGHVGFPCCNCCIITSFYSDS